MKIGNTKKENSVGFFIKPSLMMNERKKEKKKRKSGEQMRGWSGGRYLVRFACLVLRKRKKEKKRTNGFFLTRKNIF